MTIRRKTIVGMLICGVIALPAIVVAQGMGRFIGVESDDIRLIVVRLFQLFWVLVGIACASLAGYGIYLYRTAHDAEELTQGKRFIAIGFGGVGVVILISIILANVYGSMARKGVTEEQDGEFEFPSQFVGELLGQGGKIAEHFPPRDAKNIPLNVRIAIKFKQSIGVESIRDQSKKLKTDAIKIQQVFPVPSGTPTLALGNVDINSDHTIITITPAALLGEKNKKAIVAVTITNKIRNEKGEPIFTSASGYSWQFEVSGLVDNTPPQVESALPLPQSVNGKIQERYPINHLIQITFTKPIDPISISNDRVEVLNSGGSTKALGGLTIGNGFKSVTFIPQQSCGKNACGETVYCLPHDTSLRVTAKAATVPKEKSSDSPNRAAFPYDGIIDLMGNSLDGGGLNGEKKNGVSDGPPNDSFSYSFATSSAFADTPPKVAYVLPKRDGTKVDLNAPIQADFSGFMDLHSLHTGSFVLSKDLNYWISNANDLQNRKTTSFILHDSLKPNTVYKPMIQSSARDITQQCFNPCIGPTP